MLTACGVYGCAPASLPPPPAAVRISVLTAERLEQAFRALPDVQAQTVGVEGSIASTRALQANEVDFAIVMADTAYQAYLAQSEGDSGPGGQIRGIAVLNVNTVYLAAAPHAAVRSINDLRGRRVALGSPGTATAAIADLLLEASGVGTRGVRSEHSSNADALAHLSGGQLDAAFLSLNASVQAAAASGARLVPISGPWLETVRQQYPFLQTVLVPAGTHQGQTEPLPTVGVDLILACRAGLDDEMVYRLSKAYFEGLQRSAPATDLERAPATPIPLHRGAARYYRERALSR